MRTLLLSSILFLAHCAIAQTYFYIHAIDVVPGSPTAADPIEIQIHGDLSSTASFIQNVQHTIIGNVLNINVIANASGIGLDVLVPHTEVVQIGQLPAGNCSIVINGTSILDNAPPPEHQFTVTQSSGGCEGLEITSIMYEAFSDSLIEVQVTNAGPGFFPYPGFLLFNADGDTFAIETVDLFGIGEGSIQRLLIHPDANLLIPSFTGTLQLWTNFYDSLNCTFPVEVELCPPTCAPIVAYVTNLGGAITNNTFNYSISNGDGQSASGVLELADEVQFATDTVCLPPGEYTMHVTSGAGPGGGQPWAGVLTPGNFGGPQQPVTSPPVQIEFIFYEQCIEIIDQVVPLESEAKYRFSRTADHILIERMDAGPIGEVMLMDAKGAILRSKRPSVDQLRIATDRLASGAYMLKVSDMNGSIHQHKFMIVR